MKWLAISFGLFIVSIIILADMGMLGIFRMINSFPYGDKVGHFILYGILTLLIDLTFLGSHPNVSPKLVVVRVGLVLALLIGLEEYSQLYFPRRTYSLVDLFAGYFGVLFFSWVALRINKK
jgi:VanZ family protein